MRLKGSDITDILPDYWADVAVRDRDWNRETGPKLAAV